MESCTLRVLLTGELLRYLCWYVRKLALCMCTSGGATYYRRTPSSPRDRRCDLERVNGGLSRCASVHVSAIVPLKLLPITQCFFYSFFCYIPAAIVCIPSMDHVPLNVWKGELSNVPILPHRGAFHRSTANPATHLVSMGGLA